ncbi:MAG: alcohol dehydrogenase catalytic domain-containing protein [Candidatus Bathyarchaeia archaeon]
MKAAVLKGPRNLTVTQVADPRIGSRDVLIKVEAASICGSDVHMYKEGLGGEIVIGHDFSGVVKEKGHEVSKFKRGERVTAEIVRYCGKCFYCSKGKYNLCLNARYMGFDVNGAFAEYVAAPAENIIKIPEKVSLEEAAVLEPVALALHTLSFINRKNNEWVAIIGQGSVGLVLTQVAKLYSFKVIGVDVEEEKLRLCRKFGADFTVDASKENLEEKISSITGGVGVDCAIEAAGSEKALINAYEITRLDGTVLLVGWCESEMPRPPGEIVTIPVIDGPGKYKSAVKLLSQGKINVENLITHRITLDELPNFIRLMADGEVKPVKVIVNP